MGLLGQLVMFVVEPGSYLPIIGMEAEFSLLVDIRVR